MKECNSQSLHVLEIAKLQNLDEHCMRCLCYAATGCNMTFNCIKGYCGPYKVSRLYWKDAGEVTLPDDDPERAGGKTNNNFISSFISKGVFDSYFFSI